MKGRFFSILNPFGPLSPLNPGHPLNPLSSVTRVRRPPLGDLGDRHHSLLKLLYDDRELKDRFGQSVWLERVPFPNMEWWWNAIDLDVDGSKRPRLSLLTNVQLFAMPILGWVVQGTLALRDLETHETWQVHTKGEITSDERCHFSANGWSLRRDNGRYFIDVKANGIEADLEIHQGRVAYLGDRQWRGWTDNNPGGFIPYWASYRSRFSRRIEVRKLVTPQREYEVQGGHGRFDHQSLHWSPKDIGYLSPPVLAEAVITRPQWLWYDARLERPSQPPLRLTAYQVRNGHTRKILRSSAALCLESLPPDAVEKHPYLTVVTIKEDTLEFKPGKDGQTGIAFDVPEVRDWNLRADRVKLDFKFEDDVDWTVHYPIVGPFRYRAQEACGYVQGSFRGRVTRETLDLLRSISVEQ